MWSSELFNICAPPALASVRGAAYLVPLADTRRAASALAPSDPPGPVRFAGAAILQPTAQASCLRDAGLCKKDTP